MFQNNFFWRIACFAYSEMKLKYMYKCRKKTRDQREILNRYQSLWTLLHKTSEINISLVFASFHIWLGTQYPHWPGADIVTTVGREAMDGRVWLMTRSNASKTNSPDRQTYCTACSIPNFSDCLIFLVPEGITWKLV